VNSHSKHQHPMDASEVHLACSHSAPHRISNNYLQNLVCSVWRHQLSLPGNNETEMPGLRIPLDILAGVVYRVTTHTKSRLFIGTRGLNCIYRSRLGEDGMAVSASVPICILLHQTPSALNTPTQRPGAIRGFKHCFMHYNKPGIC
jgi:hypothetical protein